MTRPAHLLVVLIGLLASSTGLRAEVQGSIAPPSVSTATSNLYSEVTCTSTDPAICADALQMAEDTREQLTPLLKLGKNWRFPVHLRIITSDDPAAANIHQPGVAAMIVNKNIELNAATLASDPDLHEFIRRQFVTAILWEKFFPRDQVFDSHTRLDLAPLWLVEGLREWLSDAPDHDREAIVKRATDAKRAPTLVEINSWTQLSENPLFSLWQRAFSYYLVNSLIRKSPQRENFQDWLASLTGPNPSTANYLFPTEAGWQRELLESPQRGHNLVYTWDETAAEFDSVSTLSLAGKGDDVRSIPLDQIPSLPRNKVLIEALAQKVLVLTSLELRAHASWRPVIALYRYGLSNLGDDKTVEQGKQLLIQGRQRRAAEIDYHQKLVDYMNWFEVTHNYSTAPNRFQPYFSAAEDTENAQTIHANPLRIGLLEVESQIKQ